MMKTLVFSLILLIQSQGASAQASPWQSIFDCTPVNQTWEEQGKELFIKSFTIDYNSQTKQARLTSQPIVGKANLIVSKDESLRAIISIESSSAVFEWLLNEKILTASLVFLGSYWGFAMPVTSKMSEREPNLLGHSELKLLCHETPGFQALFILKN